MKKAYLLLLFVAAAVAVSCESILDVKSPDYYSESVIWSGNQDTFDSYCIGNYGGVRDRSEFYGLNSNFTDALTDIIKSGDWNSIQLQQMHDMDFRVHYGQDQHPRLLG